MSSSYVKHVPKHRAPAAHRAPRAARAMAVKTSLTLSSMAVVATGIAVGTGSLSLGAIHSDHPGSSGTTLTSAAAVDAAAAVVRPPAQETPSVPAAQPRVQADAAAKSFRPQIVSRSDARTTTDQLKQDTLSLGTGNTMSKTENLTSEDPKSIAEALLASFGWSDSQMGCLDSLWTRESNWNYRAENSSSGAYGIPQALPGSKMASAGSDWATNPVTQIKWGLGYIQERYGSPCSAWGHSQATGFY